LDAVTEETFIRRMNAGMKGRTIIMITHRQSSASMCDHVVKL
jgi:ABC-type transport system involved in cytochrome bd biosynthesis fused ATPase/permease subunit